MDYETILQCDTNLTRCYWPQAGNLCPKTELCVVGRVSFWWGKSQGMVQPSQQYEDITLLVSWQPMDISPKTFHQWTFRQPVSGDYIIVLNIDVLPHWLAKCLLPKYPLMKYRRFNFIIYEVKFKFFPHHFILPHSLSLENIKQWNNDQLMHSREESIDCAWIAGIIMDNIHSHVT